MPKTTTSLNPLSAEDQARRARLRYVTDQDAGYTRLRNGRGFVYANLRGKRVADTRCVARIEGLAIPPAWKEVWICKFSNGHLQATGRDSRKRKQYRYHDRWSEIANLSKFFQLKAFGDVLPQLRKRVSNDLKGSQLTRTRVVAGIVALLDLTAIRVGNEEYVKENNSYGLTTLRNRHVSVSGSKLELRFNGKGGFRRQIPLVDKKLERFITQCRALAAGRLFQYVDFDGKSHSVDSTDVNEYLQTISGVPVSAKDFRTWKASALMAGLLHAHRDEAKPRKRKAILKAAIAQTAEMLANTPTVCRNYYLHPGMLSEFEAGTLPRFFQRFSPRPRSSLSIDEQILMRFLRRWKPSANSHAE
ncbi:MAG: hypothetical protein WD851_14830 [Pirellulales bacterium]